MRFFYYLDLNRNKCITYLVQQQLRWLWSHSDALSSSGLYRTPVKEVNRAQKASTYSGKPFKRFNSLVTFNSRCKWIGRRERCADLSTRPGKLAATTTTTLSLRSNARYCDMIRLHCPAVGGVGAPECGVHDSPELMESSVSMSLLTSS